MLSSFNKMHLRDRERVISINREREREGERERERQRDIKIDRRKLLRQRKEADKHRNVSIVNIFIFF